MGPGGDPGRRHLEDVHHGRDAPQRPDRAELARGAHGRGGGPGPHGGRQRRRGAGRELRGRPGERLRVLGLGGRAVLGELRRRRPPPRAAVRDAGRPRLPRRRAGRRPPLPHNPARREPPGPPRPPRRLAELLPGVRHPRAGRLLPRPGQARPARPAARDGVQREARGGRRDPAPARGGVRGGGVRRARDERPALLLPAPAPGPRRPRRLRRLRAEPGPGPPPRRGRRQPRRADGQLLRPAGRPGGRDHGGAAPRAGGPRGAGPPPPDARGPPLDGPPLRPRRGRLRDRPAPRAVRAPGGRAGLHLGRELVRPVRRGAGQAARAEGAGAAGGLPRGGARRGGGGRRVQPLHRAAAEALPPRVLPEGQRGGPGLGLGLLASLRLAVSERVRGRPQRT
mmetsp:Transcript_7772/g.19033  ORF Transcript_7772/g.19033 Transcript_7772/m.19033 type:complete len:396 (-) Transcript_7772:600-1787(-)